MEDLILMEKSREAARQIRKDILDMTYALGNAGAHLGGSLSLADILAVLYTQVVRYDICNSDWEKRDRVILSKGHAALALYPALVQAGIIDRKRLKEFKQNGSPLSGHPSLQGVSGIEYANGSLGQGLSLAVGAALALNRKNNKTSRIYVIMGDGECDEGSVWEAAASASHFDLNQITVIIDANVLQYDGLTDEVMKMSPVKDKWISFGWTVEEVDGHNLEELAATFKRSSPCPKVIIARTVKGKGVSFIEGNKKFHNARLTREQYEQALQEVEGNL